MKRSKRIETLDKRPVNLDGYINEWPEMGFVAMKSPYDPRPSVKVQDGKIVELDGKKREDFDFIDQFIADYAINIERAEKSMSVPSLEIARMIVDIHVSRKEILEKSLQNFGYILVAENMEDAIDTANAIASAHLEIVTRNPFEIMTKIRNAGAIFLGEYSSEPLGDYFAGPNHVLPTNGTAKFFSPLSVDDFIKKSSIISYSKEALKPVYKDIVQFAECEKLTAHANSIRVRFED